jgi:hypothetical protein
MVWAARFRSIQRPGPRTRDAGEQHLGLERQLIGSEARPSIRFAQVPAPGEVRVKAAPPRSHPAELNLRLDTDAGPVMPQLRDGHGRSLLEERTSPSHRFRPHVRATGSRRRGKIRSWSHTGRDEAGEDRAEQETRERCGALKSLIPRCDLAKHPVLAKPPSNFQSGCTRSHHRA